MVRMRKMYGRDVFMADVMQNAGPKAGMYLLGAVLVVVAVLAAAGFQGRNEARCPLGDMPRDMVANRVRAAAALVGAAECARWGEIEATRNGYVLECRYDVRDEEGPGTLAGLAFDLDRAGNIVGIRQLK